MVWLREVHLDAERLPDLPELRELLSVVECQGVQEAPGQAREQSDDCPCHRVGLLGRHVGEEHEARHALRDRDEVARAGQPVDEVSLVVPHACAALDRLGALADVHAARYLAAPGAAVLLGVPVSRLAILPAHRQRGQLLTRLAGEGELLPPVVLLVDGLPATWRLEHPSLQSVSIMIRFSSVRRWYLGTPGGDFRCFFAAIAASLCFFVCKKAYSRRLTFSTPFLAKKLGRWKLHGTVRSHYKSQGVALETCTRVIMNQ